VQVEIRRGVLFPPPPYLGYGFSFYGRHTHEKKGESRKTKHQLHSVKALSSLSALLAAEASHGDRGSRPAVEVSRDTGKYSAEGLCRRQGTSIFGCCFSRAPPARRLCAVRHWVSFPRSVVSLIPTLLEFTFPTTSSQLSPEVMMSILSFLSAFCLHIFFIPLLHCFHRSGDFFSKRAQSGDRLLLLH